MNSLSEIIPVGKEIDKMAEDEKDFTYKDVDLYISFKINPGGKNLI